MTISPYSLADLRAMAERHPSLTDRRMAATLYDVIVRQEATEALMQRVMEAHPELCDPWQPPDASAAIGIDRAVGTDWSATEECLAAIGTRARPDQWCRLPIGHAGSHQGKCRVDDCTEVGVVAVQAFCLTHAREMGF